MTTYQPPPPPEPTMRYDTPILAALLRDIAIVLAVVVYVIDTL